MRLVGGATPQEGRLELQLFGVNWYAVPGVGALSDGPAQVACRSLGFAGGVQKSGEFDGDGDFPSTAVDSLECEGSEPSFNECAWTFYPKGQSPSAYGVRCS